MLMLKFINAQNALLPNAINLIQVKSKINQNVKIKIANKLYNYKDMSHFVIVQATKFFYRQC
jgi:hypothetical protein